MYSTDLQQGYKCIEELLEKVETGIILLDAGYICSDNPVKDINTLYFENAINNLTVSSYQDLSSAITEGSLVIYSDVLCHKGLTDILQLLKGYAGLSVLVDVTNSGNTDTVLRLLAGDGIEGSLSGLYTPKTIEKIMSDYSFSVVGVNDITGMDGVASDTKQYSYLVTENTLLKDYIKNVKARLDSHLECRRIIRLYNSTKKEDNGISSRKECFLSIIMRTQGKRSLELEEALLSVYGQSDQDYELLLMGHNLDEEGKANVQGIIEETPDDLRCRIRYIDVEGGTRTTPLVKGFEEAKGQYIAIFDDDDIVFDNWVEVFHNLAKENNGKILHAYCAKQNWARIKNSDGGYSLRAIGPFEKLYYRDFDEIHQISRNTSPIHALAFPKSAYNNLNIRFDEELNVVEDWDFLMRMSVLTGVANAQAITSIYRIWENTENSAMLHAQSEWDDARNIIINKLDDSPLLLPAGTASKIAAMVDDMEEGTIRKNGEANELWTFFVDLNDEKGFTADKMIAKYVKTDRTGEFNLSYENLGEWGAVRGIRLDPSELSWITIKDLNLKVMYENGTWKNVTIDEISCNGIQYNDKMLFLESDPQIIYAETKELSIASVSVSGKINYDLDQDIKDMITGFLYSKPKNVKKVFGSNKG